jgi:pimeloyl-ACP methyl ester carboxylesterase
MPRPAAHAIALILLGLGVGLTGCVLPGTVERCDSLDFLCADPCLAEYAHGDDCVDAIFCECVQHWQQFSAGDAASCELSVSSYNDAVWRLLVAACREGRLDPQRGLTVCSGGSTFTVPIDFCGFAWQPSDFERLLLPPHGHEPLLQRRYECGGVGLPLVVERARRECDPLEARFFPEQSFFAATAVLEFGEFSIDCDPAAVPAGARLTFYNPVTVRCTQSTSQPLAMDLSAPLAATLEIAPRTYLAGFIDPGSAGTQPRLNMLEPYQRGKIPLVLIHGLFSDPESWADMINDLRATPGFAERYQIWTFRYPTGRGFLASATALRHQLHTLVATLDCEQQDPALRNIVLVGHSMGGLIAKLQVTYSDEFIWNELANRPLQSIVTTEQTRRYLALNSYFAPSPNIARVIFIATPFAGSNRSSGLVGRSASLLVEASPEQEAMHDQLVRDNPDAFNPQFERRLPTSIDMLEPDSPLLDAMHNMRFNPCVALNNIIGDCMPCSLDGPSDGIVSVRSATHPCCQSVVMFKAFHPKVHRDLRASEEVLRILNVTSSCEKCPRSSQKST